MKLSRYCCLFLFPIVFFANVSFAQEFLFPLNRDVYNRVEQYIQSDSLHFFSALKPFDYEYLRKFAPVDSVFSPVGKEAKFYKTLVGRKIFRQHLLDVNEDDIHLCVDPILNTQIGRDLQDDNNVYVNTRGILVQGDMSHKFYFYSSVHENQAQYVSYVSEFVNKEQVTPGQGRVKTNEAGTFDFNSATGGIGYTAGKHFDFLLAHDKNFIGDGYRSLLLSDNSFQYPFLRLSMKFWRFKYSVIYAMMQNLKEDFYYDTGFKKKFVRVNYLDLAIGKKDWLTFGLFEAVVWRHDSYRDFDFNYINPIIFLRSVENSVGSPDNELLGANLKVKINPRNIIYGQLMLDEFLLNEVRAGRGWWANKQAFQLGVKSYSIAKIKNLNFQTEFNFVRPYTYQHRTTGQNYGQFNQPLAHPLGANFYESVTFVSYRWRNFFVEAKFNYVEMGKDRSQKNDGNYIFYNYDTRSSEYGHYVGTGLKTKLIYKEFRIEYLVNPKTNMNIEFGITDRTYSNVIEKKYSRLVYFGLRMALENYYFDF
ncbi:hypothetical protein BH11BAC1_BH11BAC1_22470 [soil metagenome]